MPELPDVAVYIDCLKSRVIGRRLERVRINSPFLLRTVTPPLTAVDGARVSAIERVGKRIAIGFDGDLWLVIHLMIAGRLRWRPPGSALPGRLGLAAFDFDSGTLLLTEAGSKRRASLHLVRGVDALAELDPGGIDVLASTATVFAEVLRRDSHTLKRALTDPRLFSGIGNAYSDEILHAARLSPFLLTRTITDAEAERLLRECKHTLTRWTALLRADVGDGFPEKVTAFREGMAVHGRYGKPCPTCTTPVQRIVYATRECNYCPTCQTGGKLLADRALSQLLRKDWPRTLEELEDLRRDRNRTLPAS